MITAPLLASALFASSVVALPNAHGEIIANFARAAPAPPTPGNFTSNATQTTINGLASLAKSGKQHLATYLISQDSRGMHLCPFRRSGRVLTVVVALPCSNVYNLRRLGQSP